MVDAAIVDGVASMMTMFSGLLHTGSLSLNPEKNLLGRWAPFYRCYVCSDGRHIAVGSLEPQFYAQLLDLIGAPETMREGQNDRRNWPSRREDFAAIFARRTQAEWCALLEGTEACFAPVLTYEESLDHPHMCARETYVEANGVKQAAPAPRFSRTPGAIAGGGEGARLLERWRSQPAERS